MHERRARRVHLVDRDPGSFPGAPSRTGNRHRRPQRGPKSANARGCSQEGCSGVRPPGARSAPGPDHDCRQACSPAARAPLQNQAPPLTLSRHSHPRRAANSGKRKRPARTPLSPQAWRPTFHLFVDRVLSCTPPLIWSYVANMPAGRSPSFQFRRRQRTPKPPREGVWIGQSGPSYTS